MDKINWKRKLTSRKFWAAVVGFVTQILLALNYSHVAIEKTTATIMAGAILIAYIIGEGMADAADAGSEDLHINLPGETDD